MALALNHPAAESLATCPDEEGIKTYAWFDDIHVYEPSSHLP